MTGIPRPSLSSLVVAVPAARTKIVTMPQGTVKSFDPSTGAAVILDDQLRELPVDPETFVASGLRELRLGQRVRFEIEGDEDSPRVVNLNIISL